MKNPFSKLKKLLLQKFRAQGFVSKYSCLKRKKWLFLKNLKNGPVFFNAFRFFSKSQRNTIKTSFKFRKTQIHRGKLYFLKSKTNYLKQLNFHLSLYLKKRKLFRVLKLANLTERRLLVLLMRCGFFNKVQVTIAAIRRGDVFVNKNVVRHPFFRIHLGDIICIKGQSKIFVLKFGTYQLITLYKAKKIILRSQVDFLVQKDSIKKRLKRSLNFQNLIVELFFLGEFLVKFNTKRHQIVGSKTFRSSWPMDFIKADIPPYLNVDYQAVSFSIKNILDIPSMFVGSRQHLQPLNLWKF